MERFKKKKKTFLLDLQPAYWGRVASPYVLVLPAHVCTRVRGPCVTQEALARSSAQLALLTSCCRLPSTLSVSAPTLGRTEPGLGQEGSAAASPQREFLTSALSSSSSAALVSSVVSVVASSLPPKTCRHLLCSYCICGERTRLLGHFLHAKCGQKLTIHFVKARKKKTFKTNLRIGFLYL